MITRVIVRHCRWFDAFFGGAKKFWTLNKFNIRHINLGGTDAAASFVYSDADGFNMALRGQTLRYDYSVLKNYFSYLADGAIVIFPISPSSCFEKELSKSGKRRYYTMLHPATIYDFDAKMREEALLAKKSPLLYMPVRTFFLTLCEPVRLMFSMVRERFCIPNASRTSRRWAETLRTKTDNVEGSCSLIREMSLFCRQRALRPVMIVLPIHPNMVDAIGTDRIESLFAPYKKLSVEENIPFFDYSAMPGLLKSSSFRTPTALNRKGAELFTRRVIDDISNI